MGSQQGKSGQPPLHTSEGRDSGLLFANLRVLNDLRTADWLNVVQYPDHFQQQIAAVIAV